jgi:Protein of unknown function (DUF3567)
MTHDSGLTNLSMNVLFNGEHYYVAEISGAQSGPQGFEVVNKLTGRGAFLGGVIAAKMRESFHALAVEHNGQLTIEQVEEFIGAYDALLMQRVVYH